MENIYEWIKNQKLKILLITCILLMLPILITHILFKWRTDIDLLNAEWSAGELLNYIGSFLAFLGTVALGALALWQNYRFHQYHVESLEPMMSMQLYSLNHTLYLSVKNTGQTEAKDLSIIINNIINNGDKELDVDDLFKMTLDLFPNETVQGMIAFDGSNICMNIFPQIEVTISYFRPDIKRKTKILRTVTFNNGYEQKVSADVNIDNNKVEENLGSVARASVRIANYLDGRQIASFDNLNILANKSLHNDMVSAIKTKDEVSVLNRKETIQEALGENTQDEH